MGDRGRLVSAVACVLLFRHGRIGRGMRAMASNVRGAQLCGYSVDAVYMFAWFVGGALAGLTGVFIAPVSGVSVELSIAVITSGFVAGVLGGFDSLKGAILGGLLLGVVESSCGRLCLERDEELRQLRAAFPRADVAPARPVSGKGRPTCLTGA